jgi:hypothetical protein
MGNPVIKCPTCESGKVEIGPTMTTLVGYSSEPGHNHDNNCRKAEVCCENGHRFIVRYRNRCKYPGCGWQGKETCWCDGGQTVVLV